MAPRRASGLDVVLTKLIAEIERGGLRVDVEETFPLDEAAKALETFTTGHTRGKIVVTVEDGP